MEALSRQFVAKDGIFFSFVMEALSTQFVVERAVCDDIMVSSWITCVERAACDDTGIFFCNSIVTMGELKYITSLKHCNYGWIEIHNTGQQLEQLIQIILRFEFGGDERWLRKLKAKMGRTDSDQPDKHKPSGILSPLSQDESAVFENWQVRFKFGV